MLVLVLLCDSHTKLAPSLHPVIRRPSATQDSQYSNMSLKINKKSMRLTQLSTPEDWSLISLILHRHFISFDSAPKTLLLSSSPKSLLAQH